MGDYRREVGTGFDIACRWIAVGLDWAFYIVLFPICYPLALLGRRERERARREHEEYLAKHARPTPIDVPKATVAEILSAARKK